MNGPSQQSAKENPCNQFSLFPAACPGLAESGGRFSGSHGIDERKVETPENIRRYLKGLPLLWITNKVDVYSTATEIFSFLSPFSYCKKPLFKKFIGALETPEQLSADVQEELYELLNKIARFDDSDKLIESLEISENFGREIMDLASVKRLLGVRMCGKVSQAHASIRVGWSNTLAFMRRAQRDVVSTESKGARTPLLK